MEFKPKLRSGRFGDTVASAETGMMSSDVDIEELPKNASENGKRGASVTGCTVWA
jgi:hypothetical protein